MKKPVSGALPRTPEARTRRGRLPREGQPTGAEVPQGEPRASVPRGGFVERDGDTWYEVSDPDRMSAFLMSLASDSVVWMYVSSNGGLTAGRGTPD